ncbi:MAG: glycosyltransferase family 4 protein [Chloroflexi bacterium]|nr:MAG: glycosyltransferase family 4 protein [Chloroflexota bacterium]
MKILLAGQAFYRRDNGQAVFTVNLAEGLIRKGYDVLVMAPSPTNEPDFEMVRGVTVQTVPAIHFRHNVNVSFLSGRFVQQTFASFKPDIVHIQDHYFLSRAVMREAERLQLPVVGTNHFLPENVADNARIPESWRPTVHKLLWRTMLSVYNRVEAVTTPTKTAVSILNQQPLQPPAAAISCGIDPHRFYPRPLVDRAAMRQKYGLDAEKAVVLYVGRVDREKNLDDVIKAVAQMHRQDVQLGIAGKGMHLQVLRQLCEEMGVNGRVHFLGFVPDDDLPLLLNSVDAFIMPGHAELQSIATLEAMSCGLPVLATNARALPELVHSGENGYLFTPGDVDKVADSLDAFADDRYRWVEMGLASLRIAAPHSLQHTVQQYVDWYEQALKRPFPVPGQHVLEGVG